MTRWDIAVLLAVLAAALAMAFFALPRQVGTAYVIIESEGATLYELPLNVDKEITITGGGGYNVLSISGGTARIIRADCPDKWCTRGAISASGQSLVCLPHRLIVRVAARDAQWDVVTP